jgi:hypothetical protein
VIVEFPEIGLRVGTKSITVITPNIEADEQPPEVVIV